MIAGDFCFMEKELAKTDSFGTMSEMDFRNAIFHPTGISILIKMGMELRSNFPLK
jgi:hypothetical protein